VDTPVSTISRFLLLPQIWKRVGHRALTHSLVFLLPSLLLGTAPFLGILSHILLDMLTPSGVQLAWPKSTSYVILGGPVRTGSRTENAISLLLFLVALYLGLAAFTHNSPFELLMEVLKR
jgi:membrane-bound metal-dependent hydrolase YbcI (DUF457 family)